MDQKGNVYIGTKANEEWIGEQIKNDQMIPIDENDLTKEQRERIDRDEQPAVLPNDNRSKLGKLRNAMKKRKRNRDKRKKERKSRKKNR